METKKTETKAKAKKKTFLGFGSQFVVFLDWFFWEILKLYG